MKEKIPALPGENEEYLVMYTAQTKQVLETLQREGVNYVKKAYIAEKYKESAWIFQTAYGFFVSEAEKYLKRPPRAESPIWMFYDKRYAAVSRDCARIKLRVPKEEVILFDLRTWTKILNMKLIGTKEEEESFEEECRRQGIANEADILRTGFYPLPKRKILESWKRLFTEAPPPDDYIQGAAWKLEAGWIMEIEKAF
ncbi:MAG: DUF3841 domain-containing protein [Johnsonella sp.]|nr:DUF3841 domain-containing protein [Johnsonella sp.]